MCAEAVTVGLPVYNGATYLEQALAGLAAQNYPALTVLVSDNASDDATPAILERWAARDARIRVHRQARTLPALANFRWVLEHASTPLFMWHAHDDWLAPDYVATLAAILAAEPGVDLAAAAVVRTQPDGTPSRRLPFPEVGDLSPLARVTTLLRAPHGVWIYGLFRTAALREAEALAQRFGEAWAADRLMLLPLVLGDRIRGTNATAIMSRKNKTSATTLRPRPGLAQARFFVRYLRANLEVLAAAPLTADERRRLRGPVIRHAFATVGFGHYNRFVKRPLRRLAGARGDVRW